MIFQYSGKENDNLENTIDRNVSALIELIESKYLSTNAVFHPFDFGRKAQYLTLDVISDVAFGQPFGCLESDSDVHEYIKTTEENLPAIILVSVLPWLNWVLQSRIFKSFLPSDKDKLGLGKIIGSVLSLALNEERLLIYCIAESPSKWLGKDLAQPRRHSETCWVPSFVTVSPRLKQNQKLWFRYSQDLTLPQQPFEPRYFTSSRIRE